MSEPGDRGGDAVGSPHDGAVLTELVTVLQQRAADPPAGSYSATLLTDPERAQRKIMEEAFELCLELGREPVDDQRAASEAADLVFHVLAGLVGAGVPWDAVLAELAARRGVAPRATTSTTATTDSRQEPS